MIFDPNYLDYIQKKQKEQGSPGSGESLRLGSPEAHHPNSSVHAAAQLIKDQHMPVHKVATAAAEKQKKLQFVQYECIKSELKEEYEKKVGFLHKRLSKKAQLDPSFLLLNSMTTQPASTKNCRATDAFFRD